MINVCCPHPRACGTRSGQPGPPRASAVMEHLAHPSWAGLPAKRKGGTQRPQESWELASWPCSLTAGGPLGVHTHAPTFLPTFISWIYHTV